jgi:tetrahydromethanopterin S-methyltransferase subunit G
VALTLARCDELRRELEKIDLELDKIVQDYYLNATQNVGGNIGLLSRMHADTVELLATKRRELEEKKN